MNVRAAHTILIPLIAGLCACGGGSSSNPPRGQFTHRTSGPTAADSTPAEAPGLTSDSATTDQAAWNPQPQVDLPAQAQPSTVDDDKPATEVKIPDLISTGKRNQPLATYEVPDKVRERLAKADVRVLPAPLPANPKFTLFNQFIDISATSSIVKFTAVLRIDGKKDEVIELSCKIEKAQTPWTCTDMYPTNPRIAQQKRLQGTFECLDTYSCDQAGVKIWVVIGGKLQEPQVFQMRGFEARIASSGDADESEPQPEQKPPLEGKDPADSGKPVIYEKDQSRVSPDPGGATEEQPIVEEKPEKLPEPVQVAVPARTPDVPIAKPLPVAKPEVKTTPPEEKVTLPEKVPVPHLRPKARPEALAPVPDDSGKPALTAEEIDKALTDPNVALEITSPMNLPAPTQGEFSPAGIEKLYPEMGKGVANQAIGSHTRGHLKAANELPATAGGMISRDHGSKDFGTDMTIDLLKKAASAVNKKYPGRPAMVIANISQRTGGTLLHRNGRAHASHKSGLDADVILPASRGGSDMWNACSLSGGHCVSGGRIADNLDEARFWLFIKQLTCAQGAPVIAMFLDRELKAHMCQYARGIGEKVNDSKTCAFKALQALYHEDGHYNHVHVRFKCPGNRDCQNSMVTLGKGSGC